MDAETTHEVTVIMGEIYDQLQRLISGLEGEGLSTMTLMSLPRPVRALVQIMLRNRGEMTYDQLLAATQSQPGERRLSQSQVDEILEAMTRLDLMIAVQQRDSTLYRVNLGQTSSGTRAQSRPGSERAKKARDRADEVWDSMGKEEESGGLLGMIRSIFGGKGR